MGMPVEKAEAFRADDLLELLGIEISPARLKCAMLSLETLEHALAETPAAGGATPVGTTEEPTA
jgi:NifU-like protein involved in Fe-S cluster formation